MSIYDIPPVEIPAPRSYEDFNRPILVTKEYYDQLPEEEKIHYELLNKKDL